MTKDTILIQNCILTTPTHIFEEGRAGHRKDTQRRIDEGQDACDGFQVLLVVLGDRGDQRDGAANENRDTGANRTV